MAGLVPDELLRQFNDDNEDAVALLARTLAGRTGAAPRVADVDTEGVVLTDGIRIAFPAPIEGPDQLWDRFVELLARARRLDPDAPLTEAERNAAELREVRTFCTAVESVEEVHRHLRRITLVGGDLASFRWPAPDAFVYVLAPPPGCDHLAVGRDFSWTTYGDIDEAVRPVGAYYTVRRWDPVATRLEILVVLHEGGAGAAWALRATPGSPVALWGPRTSYRPPSDTEHLLLAADETGLPAVAAILESLPDGVTAQVLAEVDEPDERQDLTRRDGVEVRWLYRYGTPAGTTSLLADALRELPELPPRTYVWGGGESRCMTALRRHVRHERGLPRPWVALLAYWRREVHEAR